MADTGPGPDAGASETRLSADEVRHIAALARIGMTAAEVEKFRAEISSILSHVAALQAVDTEGVPPTNNGVELVNVWAEDVAADPLPRDAVLANAPLAEDGFVRVRAVLDQ